MTSTLQACSAPSPFTVLVREVTEPLLLRDGDGEALNVIVNTGIIVYSLFLTVIIIVFSLFMTVIIIVCSVLMPSIDCNAP